MARLNYFHRTKRDKSGVFVAILLLRMHEWFMSFICVFVAIVL